MELEIKFEKPSHSWSVLYVFDSYFKFLSEKGGYQITFINSSNFQDRFQGGVNSPHVMTIKNKSNGKYLVVSYWDRAEDFFFPTNGWDVYNCVEVITSSGVRNNTKIVPFSYLPYSNEFDILSNKAKDFKNKKKCELIFRGYLYGKRLDLKNEGSIKITNEKISPNSKYFEDLTDNQICLSLNGAGEICNRDIEILSAKSVLFRPYLKQKFYDDLIPDVHYVGFDEHPNSKTQSEIIIKRFNEIKNNIPFLESVANNGYGWYKKNGTIDANVELLKKIINLDKLI